MNGRECRRHRDTLLGRTLAAGRQNTTEQKRVCSRFNGVYLVNYKRRYITKTAPNRTSNILPSNMKETEGGNVDHEEYVTPIEAIRIFSTVVQHVIRANILPCDETIAIYANARSIVFEVIQTSDQYMFMFRC